MNDENEYPVQSAQRCMRCGDYLMGSDMIRDVLYPKHTYYYSHQSCVETALNLTKPISKPDTSSKINPIKLNSIQSIDG